MKGRKRSNTAEITQRRELILSLVDEKKIKSHRELSPYLQQAGFTVGLSTISRDLDEMGIRKNSETGLYELTNKKERQQTRFRKIVLEGQVDFVQAHLQTTLFKVNPLYAELFAVTIEQQLADRKIPVSPFISPTGAVLLVYDDRLRKKLLKTLIELGFPVKLKRKSLQPD